MTWAYIDDQSTFHAKVLDAGNAAWGACVRMIAWSMSHLTDGKVPEHVAKLIASDEEIASLMRARLLDAHADGVVIHDFLEWNKSAKQIRKERAERSKAGKNGGLAKAKNAKQTPSKRLANATAPARQELGTMFYPSPSPSPSPFPEREREDLTPAAPVVPVPPKAKPAKKPRAIPTGDHAAVIEAYSKAFERAKGAKPTITGRTGGAAKRLLEAMPLERARAVIRVAFNEDWFLRQGAELWHIADSPNRFPVVDSAPKRADFDDDDPFAGGDRVPAQDVHALLTGVHTKLVGS